MERDPNSSVFVDTSIQIARRIHGPRIQKSIRDRLSGFREIACGLVVRQEFKRRLLEEARYLLTQLTKRGSYAEVRRHVQDVLSGSLGHNRKRQICLQTLATIDEQDSEDDRTERMRLYLRNLLRFGLSTFDAELTRLYRESGCASVLQPVVEKKENLKYEFGFDKCSKTGGRCSISAFLAARESYLRQIGAYIAALPAEGKTEELTAAEAFIAAYLADPRQVEKLNPCSVAGDVLIALESIQEPTFYTMNSKESRHLCHVLGQRMILRHPNPDHPERDLQPGGDWSDV